MAAEAGEFVAESREVVSHLGPHVGDIRLHLGDVGHHGSAVSGMRARLERPETRDQGEDPYLFVHRIPAFAKLGMATRTGGGRKV
ncbi:hypothetical protein ABGB14_01805 [Nonomuraea sp. B10E15]|uniref:hypothetical protein n=1 Tax=Nonomuraea sp. B10E15 TaxID=3153560 RepID=UPI00325E6533